MRLEDISRQVEKDPHGFVAACEAEYDRKIDAIADAVASDASECPIVLLSGPSGSGKTTTAHRIAERLERRGLRMHIVSMDNYFRSFTDEEQALFRKHKLDLESPDRMNGELMASQLEAIMRGEEIRLPRFDFTTNISSLGDKTLRLGRGELVIFEGIHALNPDVLGSTDDYTTRIYVSVRTRLEFEDGRAPLHPSMVRLARRMIRDRRERGRTFSDVVELYASVERGENLYIMPYKHRANHDVDTLIPYELCVYKNSLPPSMPDQQERHPWLGELFAAIGQLPALNPDILPPDTLIREFVGR